MIAKIISGYKVNIHKTACMSLSNGLHITISGFMLSFPVIVLPISENP